LLEVIPIQLLGALAAGPVISRAIQHYDPWTRERGELIGAATALIVHGVVDLAWFLLRDTVPGLSWGKRIMGLHVVRGRSDSAAAERAGFAPRLFRNVLLAIPLWVAIEGLVSLSDSVAARRIGDRIAGTAVQYRTLPLADHRLAIWQLALAMALFAGCIAVQPVITEWAFEWAYYGR
jgi:uncharacterized RDD family membrane protein YckC